MAGERSGQVPFQAHTDLLRLFLAHRKEVVEGIQGVLNAQRKPADYLQDRALLSRLIEDCFFGLAAVTADHARLRGRLQEAHWASGFKPRQVTGFYNELIDPAEMMIRGFHCWQQTRWPGRNGRVAYAQTLFDLYLLRGLELASMRLWDDGVGNAGERLAQLQAVLDALRSGAPADQPVLVRDARWLIPLAQSPTTDDLGAYFEVSQKIAQSFAEDDLIEVRKASVQMIAGHLRSQIRHYMVAEGVSLDEKSVVLRTRTSNALDFALLVQGLVPLLEAYEHAAQNGDAGTRRDLASAICQAVSADPELFLNRVDLLCPYSMIDYLFVTTDRDREVVYTPTGRWHLGLLRRYQVLIDRLSTRLHDDCLQFRPADGAYSPYGAIFGTPSNLTEDMALKTLDRDAVTRFGLEDVFSDGDAEKLDWVNGWRKLPHVAAEVQRLYQYPQRFAEDIFERIERALQRCAVGDAARGGVPTGRLFVATDDDSRTDVEASSIPDLPVRYIVSSDRQAVDAHRAVSYDEMRLLRDRQEGYFVVSYETPGGWMAVHKDFLTEVLAAGCDARIAGLPSVAARVLTLMGPDIVVAPNVARQASAPPSMLKA